MPYPALPDRRMPYDNDGTLVYDGTNLVGAAAVLSGAEMIELNDNDQTLAKSGIGGSAATHRLYFFFPEQREITGIWCQAVGATGGFAFASITGSNDTANGEDGTWETASMPGGYPAGIGGAGAIAFDVWRSGIKAVSFTGPKKNVRISATIPGTTAARWHVVHWYGEAAAGAMAHDLVYINHDDTPGVEFTAPEDFGDQPLGTTVVRQFRIKNTSATRTATGINIQCNDPDFVIAESAAGPWVVTINLASLAPGAESPTYYIRLTTPAPGAPLAPRFARIVTVCDAGFFG